MIEKLTAALFADELTIEAARRWRFTVAAILLVLCLGGLWAIGLTGKFGVPGFAYAGEVDAKIAKSVAPIHEEQIAQRQLITMVSEQLKETLAEGKAAEIRTVAVKRCKEKLEDEREFFNKEIDRKQAEYYKLVTHYYAIPECSAL